MFLELVMQPQLALKTPHVAVEFLLLNIYSVLDCAIYFTTTLESIYSGLNCAIYCTTTLEMKVSATAKCGN